MRIPLAALIALAAPVHAQCLRGAALPLGPDPSEDRFGWSVDAAGPFVIAGAYEDDEQAPGSGAAYVIDAVTGDVLHKLVPADPQQDQFFGIDVAIEGNLALVGAILDDEAGVDCGAVYLFDVSTGAQIGKWLPPNPQPGSQFGAALDVQGGVAIVGTQATEAAFLIDVASGNVLHELTPSRSSQGFGRLAELDGGFAVVGAPFTDGAEENSGAVFVFDVSTGLEVHELQTDEAWYGAFGYHLSASMGRVAVSAKDAIRVFDLATGNLLATHAFSFFNRYPVALHADSLAVGFFSEDGYEEYTGSVRVFDSLTGLEKSWLADQAGVSRDRFGMGLAMDAAGLFVGVPFSNVAGVDAGQLRIYDHCGPVGQSYCGPSVPNSTGQSAVLEARGDVKVVENQLLLRARDLPLDHFGYFLASSTQGFVVGPGGSDGNLCLGGTIARYSGHVLDSGNAGRFELNVDLTAIPTSPTHAVQPGETWNFQAWFRDGATSNFTDAVSITYQ